MEVLQGVPGWLSGLLTLVIAAGGVGSLIALLNLGKTRAKMSADASKVITEAATALVGPLTAQVNAHKAEADEREHVHDGQLVLVNKQMADLRREVKAWHAGADEHSPWDIRAEWELRRAGIDVGPMPPLRPSLGALGPDEVTVVVRPAPNQ